MKKSLAAIIFGLMLTACSSNDESATTESDITPDTPETITPVTSETETDSEPQLPMPPNLAGAIEAYKPNVMEFHNEYPTVLGAYALWDQSIGLSWDELNAIEKTSYGKVMKDPEAEYGKRLCVTGEIIEIETDRSLGYPIYNLGIHDSEYNIYRATAVKSSGDLVEGSSATLCGIVVAKIGYDNAAGGTTRAPYLFGMFDLPENK